MSERPLKIAFLVGQFPAISETFILNQITGLIDAGHQVDIYARSQSLDQKRQTEVDTYRLMERTRYIRVPGSIFARFWNAGMMVAKMVRQRKFNIVRAFDLRRLGLHAHSLRLVHLLYPLLEGGPYDILHCHFGPIGLTGLRLKELGVPGKLIVTFHGHDVSQFVAAQGENVYQRMFAKADLLMPVSQYWKRRLVQINADPAKVRVHHMGIDLAKFPFRARSLASGEEIRLLTVGRLVEKKGIRYALQAVASLAQRRPDWRVRYDIVGSGEQEGELRRLIAELGLQEHVFLAGSRAREEILRCMMDAHIFLLPSITDDQGDQEGIPVSLMEAMATGLPVLSTQHTGIPELVRHGVTGSLVPERDVDGLVEQLEALILHPEHWPEMGRRSRRIVENDYNIHKLNRQLIDTYRGLLAGTLAPGPAFKPALLREE